MEVHYTGVLHAILRISLKSDYIMDKSDQQKKIGCAYIVSESDQSSDATNIQMLILYMSSFAIRCSRNSQGLGLV